VARAGLGTINHTLLTLEVAEARRLPVAGIVLNEVHARTTREAVDSALAEIADRTTVPVLARIPHESSAHLSPANWASTIDWRALAECEPSR
jgi:dethiobiotin synthetase